MSTCPDPLAPLMRTRSPASICSVTGPSTKSPCRASASSATATTEPERGADAISIHQLPLLAGLGHHLEPLHGPLGLRDLAACFSERCPARLRMCLSRSASLPPDLRIVFRTPLSSHVFCVWMRLAS